MANIDTSKIYSEEQKTRMIDKLKNMPNKTVWTYDREKNTVFMTGPAVTVCVGDV